VGAHACFTLSNETLESVAGLASDLGVGVHVHVAEDAVDCDAGARLETVSGDDWLLAHCVHLDRHLPGTIAHNARSNMNNAVGYSVPSRYGNAVVLGTDGIGGDMLEEFRIAYVRLREQDVTSSPELVWSWLEGGERIFPEVAEDSVTWSYSPVVPWHVAFTPGISPREVVVGGELVLSDGRPTRVDATEVRRKSREQAERLWARL
jgi:hypothetical protein